MAGKDFSSFADNDSSEESTIGGSKGSKGSDKTKSTSGNTIQDKNYKAEDSKSSENSKDTNAEATSLVKKMQQREEKNKETLNKLRQLNDKVFKRKITVKAVLKAVKESNKVLKQENKAAEEDVKDAVDNLQKLRPEKEVPEKIFNAKGRLKKDDSLPQALNDLLKDLQNAADKDKKDIEEKMQKCKDMESELEDMGEDENGKQVERGEMAKYRDDYRNRMKALEKDVVQWRENFYETIKAKREKSSDSLLESFQKVMNLILELADACDEAEKNVKNLSDQLKNLQKSIDQTEPPHETNVMAMKKLEEMPKKCYDKIFYAVEYRENISLPPAEVCAF